jgi:hypothetical protein
MAEEWSAASVVTSAALDDCMMTVMAAPMRMSTRRPRSAVSGKAARPPGGEVLHAALKGRDPTNSMPNPAITIPDDAFFPRERSMRSAQCRRAQGEKPDTQLEPQERDQPAGGRRAEVRPEDDGDNLAEADEPRRNEADGASIVALEACTSEVTRSPSDAEIVPPVSA